MLHPLRLRRLEKGLSQHALSYLSGVPQVRICYAEKGYPALNQKQREALATVLGCCVEDLFPSSGLTVGGCKYGSEICKR